MIMIMVIVMMVAVVVVVVLHESTVHAIKFPVFFLLVKFYFYFLNFFRPLLGSWTFGVLLNRRGYSYSFRYLSLHVMSCREALICSCPALKIIWHCLAYFDVSYLPAVLNRTVLYCGMLFCTAAHITQLYYVVMA